MSALVSNSVTYSLQSLKPISQCKLLYTSGPEETLYTTTEHPSLNQSLSSGSSLPNNSSSSNRTILVVLPRTTKLPASSNPPITTTTPSNGKDQAMVAPSRSRRQATIMISILLFFIAVIVVSIVLGCVVYRRRRARRIQRKSHEWVFFSCYVFLFIFYCMSLKFNYSLYSFLCLISGNHSLPTASRHLSHVRLRSVVRLVF